MMQSAVTISLGPSASRPASRPTAFYERPVTFSVVASVCVIGWLGIRSLGRMGDLLAAAVLMALLGFATLSLIRRRIAEGLALISYMAVLEPYFKANLTFLPYLTLQYMTIVWMGIILAFTARLSRQRWPVLVYGAYVCLEIFGLLGVESFQHGRAVLLPSVTLLLFMGIAMQAKLDERAMKLMLAGFVFGGLSLGATVAYGFLTGEVFEIAFSTESNRTTSGGMGPVQVSFTLATSAFLLFWLSTRCDGLIKWIFRGGAVLLCFFMIMTFSRGGLYMIAGATFVFLVARGRLNWKAFVILGAALIGGYFVIRIGTDVTGGALLQRYRDLSTSNRFTLIQYGWEIFRDHPLLGVGTGGFYAEVQSYFGMESGAHNELIRSAAEHGIVGFMLWILFALTGAWYAFFGASQEAGALRLALFCLFVASTFHNGLKLLVQPLLVMLAFSYKGNPRYFVQGVIRGIRPNKQATSTT